MSLFIPQYLNGHILNAQQPDQLAPCVKIPRISSPTKTMAYCTQFSMVKGWSDSYGFDTMIITSHSDLAIFIGFFRCMRIQQFLDGMIFTYFYNIKAHQNKYHLNSQIHLLKTQIEVFYRTFKK